MNEPGSPRKGGEEPENPPPSGRARIVGIALMVGAVLLWTGAAVAFLLPLSGGQKAWTITAFLAAGEAFFWISAVLLGREMFRRYRSYLDPRRFFRREDR